MVRSADPAGRRTALLVATDTYRDSAFTGLAAPRQDAAELAELLGDPAIGDFTTTVLTNAANHEVRIALNDLFGDAGRHDQLLFYVTGHGVKDEGGNLHLVMADTQRNRLPATAVGARYVRELIDGSAARRVVVWLDCCYAGAFPAGMRPKAEGAVDVLGQFDTGRGCVVMTSSTHVQYAYERGGDVRPDGRAQPSIFTNAIAKGLRTGAADLNADGVIDAAELYTYVRDQVRLVTPSQTPTRNDQVTGELYIAHSKLGLGLPTTLDTHLRSALRSPFPLIRLGAVSQLGELARANDPDSQEALRRLADGSDQELAGAASEELEGPRPRHGAEPGPIAIGIGLDVRRAIQIDFTRDQHLLIVGGSQDSRSILLNTIAQGVVTNYTRQEASYVRIDPGRDLRDDLHAVGLLGSASDRASLISMVAAVRKGLGGRDSSLHHLFVLVDDYERLGKGPLADLVEYAGGGSVHLVIACGPSDAASREDSLMRRLVELDTPMLADGRLTAQEYRRRHDELLTGAPQTGEHR